MTAIHKWISSHKANKFIVIVPTVNIAEGFYTKLSGICIAVCGTDLAQQEFDSPMNRKLKIRLCVNDNVFQEFHKGQHDEVNVIITTYNNSSKCLGDLLEKYYARGKRPDYFFVIDEAYLSFHML